MRHVADVFNFIASIVAVSVAAYMAMVVALMALPFLEEEAIGYVYLGASFVAGALAGAHLMTHLRWRRRLQIIIVVPLLIGVATSVAQVLRLDTSIPLADRLGFVAETQLRWFIMCAGLSLGAILCWSRGPQRSTSL